jgi:hypothetical protein
VLATTARTTYSQMVNDSLNQVLMRTLNTSITALIPITSLLVIGSFVLGAATLQEFALALLIGLGSGAYSSIFIASPLLAVLKEREPRYTSLRNCLEGRTAPLVATGGGALLRPSAAARSRVDVDVGEEDGAGRRGDEGVPSKGAAKGADEKRTASGPSGPIAPRARKKGKRR